MPAAPIMLDEPVRLAALRGLQILDTPADPRLDRYVVLAQLLARTETAALSFVDAERQWFKARRGMEASETCRDLAFCAHAILGHEVLWVEDARADARFADNPLVISGPAIRFYAGAPLTIAGERVGTICVFDPAPRPFDAEISAGLALIAELIAEDLHPCDGATAPPPI
jgi:GAF domain-containing protein